MVFCHAVKYNGVYYKPFEEIKNEKVKVTSAKRQNQNTVATKKGVNKNDKL